MNAIAADSDSLCFFFFCIWGKQCKTETPDHCRNAQIYMSTVIGKDLGLIRESLIFIFIFN